MSYTIKRPYKQVRAIADKIVERLAPACTRIEIAGSLRREKEMIGDIEIIAIPRIERPVLGRQSGWTEVDKLLEKIEGPTSVQIRKGTKNRGLARKYVQFSFATERGTYMVDLFLQPDPATWGVNFMVRTGSADFSAKMVTPKSAGGLKPDGITIQDARVFVNGAVVETPEEEDIFRLWKMNFVHPVDRK